MSKGEKLRLEPSRDFRSRSSVGGKRFHCVVGETRVEKRADAFEEIEGHSIYGPRCCPRRRIVLVDGTAAAARVREIVIEVTVSACPLNEVKHSVGYGSTHSVK